MTGGGFEEELLGLIGVSAVLDSGLCYVGYLVAVFC